MRFVEIAGLLNRYRKWRFIRRIIFSNDIRSCLVVGAEPASKDTSYTNFLEKKLLSAIKTVVISGMGEQGGGWENWIEADGTNLPFGDQSFDLVFSNAVIEHVGDINAQRKFLNEHVRVGKFWLLTTPNRKFPIEAHAGTLFKHVSGKWTPPGVTRLLSKGDLYELARGEMKVKGSFISPTLMAYSRKLKD